jgi:hypothetical protein
VRQQFNWFRLDDPHINWFDLSEGITHPLTFLRHVLGG